MNEKLEIVSEAILGRLNTKRAIPDEMMSDFAEVILEYVREHSCDSESTLIDFDSAYTTLANELRRVHAYDHASRYTSDEALRIGFCLGCSTIKREYDRLAEDMELLQRQKEVIKKHESVFVALRSNNDLTHKELAEKTGNSAPRLSQIISEIRPFQLISVMILGRTKRYSLTPISKKMVDELVSAKEKSSSKKLGAQKSNNHRWHRERSIADNDMFLLRKGIMEGLLSESCNLNPRSDDELNRMSWVKETDWEAIKQNFEEKEKDLFANSF